MAVTVDAVSGGPSSSRGRKFGPLLGIAIAAVLALLVLPSNFTLPNSTPSPQVEIAPVPPMNHQTQQQSNFTKLNQATQGNGLGGAGGGGGKGGAGGKVPGAPKVTIPPGGGIIPGGSGVTPANQKECVAGKQTEDPLTPPCVAYFQGNNGGATFQGVTGTNINVLVYEDSFMGLTGSATGPYTTPTGAIINLDHPPPPQDRIPNEQALIGWERFFNYRFQTYDRHVDFWIQFATYDDSQGGDGEDSQSQTVDAANAYEKVHPFAVIDESSAFGGGGTGYVSYMNQHDVLVFGTAQGLPSSLYNAKPGFDYGYAAPIERSASQYAQFVCSSLAGKPADDVGNNSNGLTTKYPVKNGVARRYGYIYTTDPSVPSLTEEGNEAMADIKKMCGITPVAEATFPSNGYVVDTSQLPTYATEGMAKFKQAGVTTVLWPAGFETKFSTAAEAAEYSPEWILGDDLNQPGNSSAQFQNPTEWAHAWDVTSITYTPVLQSQICYIEYRQADTSTPDENVQNYACPLYPVLRQLFTGIQVAGPDLTPVRIDEGFHAIPEVASKNPQVPSCFYLPGDYTCVKDSTIEHYDPSVAATDTDNDEPGAWRMVNHGARYLSGQFPHGNLLSLKKPNDIVNQYDVGDNLNEDPP